MDGKITGENERLVGLSVIDNNGAEHLIEMTRDGEITGHQCDAYASEGSERSREENEHNNQARRFARFYVYRKRGYDTIEPMRNPDDLSALLMALGPLDAETLLEYVGDYYQQLRYCQTGANPIIETPRPSPNRLVWIEQDVTLTDHEDVSETLATLLDERGVLDEIDATIETGGNFVDLAGVLSDHDALGDDDVVATLADETIDEIGPLRVCWQEGTGPDSTRDSRIAEGTGTTDSLTGEPAVRLQMHAVYDISSPERFRLTLIQHLRCQIRDCYIGMGIAPPPTLRVLGEGIGEYISWYRDNDIYEPYYDTDQSVTELDWQEEHTPEEFLIDDMESVLTSPLKQ